MIIQFNKKTGEIIASYPEAFGKPPGIEIRENGKVVISKKDVDYLYLMPLDAQEIEDPLNPKQIHHYFVELDKNGKPKHLTHKKDKDEKIVITRKDQIKETIEAWSGLFQYLKTQYPNLKIIDALKKVGIIKL